LVEALLLRTVVVVVLISAPGAHAHLAVAS